MKLLLTSGGVSNASIRDALTALLGKPIEESTALCIPSAEWGHPWCTPYSAREFLRAGTTGGLGWKRVGLLELTALPTIPNDRWVPWVRDADALVVDGGEATYLAYWLRQSGLADLFPSLERTVWVGMSAGSMVMTPRIGDDFVGWDGNGRDDRTLGLVGFSIFPHLNHPDMSGNTLAHAKTWADRIGNPAYALDDNSAIQVVGTQIEIISEGEWTQLR